MCCLIDKINLNEKQSYSFFHWLVSVGWRALELVQIYYFLLLLLLDVAFVCFVCSSYYLVFTIQNSIVEFGSESLVSVMNGIWILIVHFENYLIRWPIFRWIGIEFHSWNWEYCFFSYDFVCVSYSRFLLLVSKV